MGARVDQGLLRHGGDAQLLGRLLDRRARRPVDGAQFRRGLRRFPDRRAGELPYTAAGGDGVAILGPERLEEHTSELQSPCNLVCRLLLEKKKNDTDIYALLLHIS